jgi:hypothetical protein
MNTVAALWLLNFSSGAIVAQVAGTPQPSLGRIILCASLVLVGLVTHFVTKLAELEQRGTPVDAAAHLKAHKWSVCSVVLGAYGLLILAYYAGEMGPVGSFCMGVAANSAGDKLRARAQAKVESLPAVPPGK